VVFVAVSMTNCGGLLHGGIPLGIVPVSENGTIPCSSKM